MKNICHLLFAIYCLLLLPNSAFSFNNQLSIINNHLEIGSIETAGNRSISSIRILSKVHSRVGQLFDPTTAAEDAKRIAELSGVEYSYYNTAIVENKIQLTFVVVERNIVRSIVFVGNRKYKTKTLRKKLGIRIADYLDTISVESAAKTLIEFYLKKGFAFVQVRLDSEQLPRGKLIYTIDEGPRVKIKSVKFSVSSPVDSGNSAIKTGVLKRAVKIKKKKFLLFSRYYVEKDVARDVVKLQNVYQKRGFLDAAITANRQFSPDRRRVELTFVIDEGRCFTVEKIVFAGNKHFDEETLGRELKLKAGQVYSEQKAVSDVKRLLKLYRENGFIEAGVGRNIKFVSETSVNVEFEVAEGQRFRIGRINITGNKETQDKVIRRILDEYDFQPGRWYNADIARGDAAGSGYLEKLIRRTTYAESARITPSGQMPNQKDVQVSITEGQTGSVMVGAGVASDSGVIGQFVYEQRNFDISDYPKSFREFITGRAFRGAGQSLRISLQPGTVVSQYSVSFTEPYLKNKPVSLNVAVSSYERWRESYNENRAKGYVGFEKRYKNRWRKSIGFRAENVDVGDIEFDAPKEIRDVKGGNALVGVRLGTGRDITDDKFNPGAGYSFNASYEQVGGDYTFGVLRGTYRWYKTLHEDLAERKTILGTKLHAATVIGDAPPFEKFYAGGQGSIRGFDYWGVSTRGLQTNVANPERKDPIGSDWIFLANAELIVPFASESFAILLFVDSGTIDSGNYRVAVGTGIQILLPQWFGPVPMRFELAAPVMKDEGDETQVFSFSVGRLF